MATATFKTQAYLDKQTAEFCERAFGVRRWVWNWSLAYYKQQKRDFNKTPTWQDTTTALRAAVASQQDEYFKYLVDAQVSSKMWDEACKDLAQAFKLSKTANRKANTKYLKNLHKKARYKNGRKVKQKRNKLKKIQPMFISKRDAIQTFSRYHTDNSAFRPESSNVLTFTEVKGHRGIVKIRESFDKLAGCKLLRMTIKKEAGKYYLCIVYEKPNLRPVCRPGKLGIDLGVKKSVVSYNGEKIETYSFNTNRSRKYDRLAKKASNSLSRKQIDSKRYEKAVLLCARRAKRAADIRNYRLETTTTYLAQNYSEIKVDDFNFEGAKQLIWAREQLYRCMNYKFKERLQQKAAETGCQITFVNHFKGEKTTAKCSHCGSEKFIITNNDRTITCSCCGNIMDRDENAAINAFNLLK